MGRRGGAGRGDALLCERECCEREFCVWYGGEGRGGWVDWVIMGLGGLGWLVLYVLADLWPLEFGLTSGGHTLQRRILVFPFVGGFM